MKYLSIGTLIWGLTCITVGSIAIISTVKDAVETSFTVNSVVFILFILLFPVTGILLIKHEIKTKKLEEELRNNGRVIRAKIEEIVVRHGRKHVSNRHIVAKHENHTYKSALLTVGQYHRAMSAEFVDVYSDKLNPEVYFVDLDSL